MKKYIVSICLGMVFLSSCSNWLDVQPKTTVEEEKVFSRELGFKEALTGVYIKMASTDLYARNLSYGFIDILGQRYQASDALTYQNELWYTFPSTKTESYTKTIWEKMYNIIANVNNLLYYCDENKQVFTTGHYYEIIKGEALGLRAFLHFDLLRMFGPVYKDNPTSKRITYRTEFSKEIKELQPSNVVMDSIISDLKKAETLLTGTDPLNFEFPVSDYEEEDMGGDRFLVYRHKRMNLYAVKALLARVYLYAGNKTEAENYANQVIGSGYFDLIGDASDVLDYQTFKDWMTVDSSGNVSFDWNHIADWIGQLADKYDTFGTDETFHTSLGETVTVTSMNYGWKMDEETEAAWLDETLKSGESATRQPQWLESAMARGEENDIGDTYVEIDITNQRMWFYKDGQCLVDTPVVTGDATKDGYETPLGLYCLFDKEAKAILRGADNLSGKSYNTPVDYWMPFNGGVGIHDAKWRASFGGTLYQGNGSHGCVNTPWDQAGIIFDNIEIGTPIVVYKSSINQGTGSVAISQPAETRVINEQGVEVTPESSAADTTTGTTTDTLSDPTSYTAIDGQ